MKLDVLKPCDLLCQVEGHMAPPCQCVILQVPCHSQLLYDWPTLSCDCTAHPPPMSTPTSHHSAQAAPESVTLHLMSWQRSMEPPAWQTSSHMVVVGTFTP